MLAFQTLGQSRVKWHLTMRSWHGTMNRVNAEQIISQTLAHSLHLHHACSWTCLVNLNNTPTSDVELKVFTVGLFGGCHPFKVYI